MVSQSSVGGPSNAWLGPTALRARLRCRSATRLTLSVRRKPSVSLAAAAGVGMWQAWRSRRWSPAGHGLLTVVVALLLVTAVLIW